MGIGMVQNGYGAYACGENTEAKTKRSSFGRSPEKECAEKTEDYMAYLREKSEEILEKLRNGETEVSYPIGGESYTEREWDKLMEKFDDIQEDVRRKMEERFKKMEEKEEERTV